MRWVKHFLLTFLLVFVSAIGQTCPQTITGIALKSALDRRTGPGHGVLADTHSIPPLDMAAVRTNLSGSGSLIVHPGRQNLSPGMFFTDSHQWRASAETQDRLRAYTDQLAVWVNLALPYDEQVIVSGAELRVGLPGVEANHDMGWHEDGDYLAAAVVLSGIPMRYLVAQDNASPGATLEVPIGKTFVYSCERRSARFGTRPTIHRHFPSLDSVLLIVRFAHIQDARNP
jgi:hypothetical protein